ncbi:HlyD family efflux transporter periplasmic adaptor subunit [Desulfovibrio sp. ZJ369]|uniref:HlyD family secretion protein n=1 Tax=Desulfovibrio sp. ZJ369 TaxID=2709793 RepID=UPI0013EACB8A|nr:HlyD family efflux transporter periplasmic adaptor subunit [Desulfovibrio sp. ZJ369]
MAELLYLEMPARKKSLAARLLRLSVLMSALAALLLGLSWWWLASGRVDSVWGMLDGMIYTVSPDFSGHLAEINVREGERVEARQPVARMDADAFARQLRRAGQEAAGLRPPDMQETAARVKQAQEAEKDMVLRLAQARHEEEAMRARRDERVTEHVRAQLALRSLDSQGGERMVGKSRYATARRAEAEARARMQSAKDEFEQASRVRAALDQELGRVRDEILRARQWASRNRYAPAAVAGPSTEPLPAQVDDRLYAPVSGRVLRALAASGQILQRGDPVMLILPEGSDRTQAFWVLACFPLESQQNIKVGQTCDVRLTAGGETVRGQVAEVLAPQPLPAGQSAKATAQADKTTFTGATLFLPARITLADLPADPPMPGSPASCVVKTRSIFGFSGF